MATRREFLQAGGLALAGLALPSWLDIGRGRLFDPLGVPSFTARLPVEIRMRSNALGSRVWFDPIAVRVSPGATVRWVLEANVHSATAYHPVNGNYAPRIPAGAEPWDSGLLTEPGQAFTVRLVVPGVYDYFCLPHELAGMVGRIVVAPEDARALDLPEPGPASPGLRTASEAARAAFPSIARILEKGVVRLDVQGPKGRR